MKISARTILHTVRFLHFAEIVSFNCLSACLLNKKANFCLTGKKVKLIRITCSISAKDLVTCVGTWWTKKTESSLRHREIRLCLEERCRLQRPKKSHWIHRDHSLRCEPHQTAVGQRQSYPLKVCNQLIRQI